MKIAGLLSIMVVAMSLVGCENSELISCQQEQQVLTMQTNALEQQLEQAKSAITERDGQIEQLKIENTNIQTKAMESISTMMQKQAAADEKLKKELSDAQEELKVAKQKLAVMQAEQTNLQGLYENAKKSFESLEKEKQALNEKLNEILKTAAEPVAPATE